MGSEMCIRDRSIIVVIVIVAVFSDVVILCCRFYLLPFFPLPFFPLPFLPFTSVAVSYNDAHDASPW